MNMKKVTATFGLVLMLSIVPMNPIQRNTRNGYAVIGKPLKTTERRTNERM